LKEIKEKKCDHTIRANALFGDRDLIELRVNKAGNLEWEAHNGNMQPAKLKFCTKCGSILIKLN